MATPAPRPVGSWAIGPFAALPGWQCRLIDITRPYVPLKFGGWGDVGKMDQRPRGWDIGFEKQMFGEK